MIRWSNPSWTDLSRVPRYVWTKDWTTISRNSRVGFHRLRLLLIRHRWVFIMIVGSIIIGLLLVLRKIRMSRVLMRLCWRSRTFRNHRDCKCFTNCRQGVPHASMTSREYFYKRENKPNLDERLFDNFKIEKSDIEHTPSFKKMRGRSMNIEQKHINGIGFYNV